MANPNWKLLLLRALLIGAAGFWVFAPTLRGDWLWDDDRLITDNSQLRNLDGLWKIWFEPGSQIEYYPVEHTALWIEWHLWHNNPLGYHLVTLTLHLISALLVWWLLGRLGLRLAWLGGFLFAIHPAQVESAAWISELKNTLSMPLFLLSCDAWLDAEEGRKNGGYLRSVLYYLAAMLTKTSVVMLPLALLLYNWWRRGGITRRDVMRTIPYFAIALALGIATIHFQNQGHEIAAMETGDFFVRTLNAGMALCFYLGKFVLPTGLLPIYPAWMPNTPALVRILPVTLLALLGFGLWTQRKSWGRHALFGFGFFILNLLPVLGFIKMEYMNVSPVADHFIYVPIIGLIGLVMASLEALEDRISSAARPGLAGITATMLALLAWRSHVYAEIFTGPEKLWTYTVERNPTSWLAYNNLGDVLLETGRAPEAIEAYEKALRLNPHAVEAHNNLGLALYQQGRTSEAIDQYEQALKFNPHFALAHTNLGNALAQTGRVQEAIEHYEHALLVNPQDSDARTNLTKLKARARTP